MSGIDPASAKIFAHGVASGDPDQTSLVIWTRVSGFAGQVRGSWQIATDLSFRDVVSSGNFATAGDRDYTIKALVSGLQSGRQYFYRFEVNHLYSPVGRTQTLASGHIDRLGIAVASCSNYPFGYFNAYEAIAADPAIDLVLHLGDYLYEYGPDGYGGETGKRIGREHVPPREIVSLQDYRQRHAQYKSDVASQAMHAAHPIIAIWDDHESANNPWMGGAENHQSDAEGDWEPRKQASLRAYYEWMPVRDPAAGGDRAKYWRHFQIGDLASLITLETRHTGRAEQINYSDHRALFDSEQGVERFKKEILGDPSRDMLSDEMQRFLTGALRESQQRGARWRLIGNQIPMARTQVPRLEQPFFARQHADSSDPLAEELAGLVRLGELDLPIYLDTWDGYPQARERFYSQCEAEGVRDLLVLTGDSHSFWANALFNASGRAMGVELGTSGISSPGDFVRFDDEGATLMDELLVAHNREVVWTDGRHNGYIRLLLNHQQARADFVSVTTVLSRNFDIETIRRVSIERSSDGSLVYV